jgi:gliding motility-associated-like protein
MTAPQDITVSCGQVPQASTISFSNGLTDGCAITGTSNLSTFTTSVPGFCNGQVVETWTATDACGRVLSPVSRIIHVIDNTPPVITVPASNLTVECDGTGNTAALNSWLASKGGAVANDLCSDVTWTNNFQSLSNLCGATGSATVTFTVKDLCGNPNTTTATFTIVDLTAPVVTCPTDITVNNDPEVCGANVVVPQPDVVEQCGTYTLLNSFNSTSNASGFYGLGTTNVVWTATDECGNISASCTMHVTVIDNTVPVISGCPSDIIGYTGNRQSCDQIATWTPPTATDNCTGPVTVTSNYYPGNLFPVGSTTVIYTFTDASGNVSTCSFNVTIIDNTPPVITCPANVIACESEPVILGTATATDNCGIAGITNNAPQVFPVGITTVIWTATDIHGNSSSCNQTVTVNPAPLANAGPNASVCQGTAYDVAGASASNYTSILWTTTGAGTLKNETTLTPTYEASATESGTIMLILTVYGTPPCGTMTDTLYLTVVQSAQANAGPDVTTCQGEAVTITDATASPADGITWSSNGLGTLANEHTLSPTYTPGQDETGTITLYLAVTGDEPCPNASDEVTISIEPKPVFIMGGDISSCGKEAVAISGVSLSNYSSVTWTTSGTGTFSNPNVISPIYYPSDADVTGSPVYLVLNAKGLGACENKTFSDSLKLTLKLVPVVNAGNDQDITAGSTALLSGSASGSSNEFSYSWQPTELVTSPNSAETNTVALQETTTFVLTVQDLVTGCSGVDTIIINIVAKHLPPVAVNDFDTTAMNTFVTVPVIKNDYDLNPNPSPLELESISKPPHGDVARVGDSVRYTPNTGFSGDDSFTYTVKNIYGMDSTATVYVHVNAPIPLVIHNVVTPNGDGFNDNWVIEGIEEFPDNSILILNRWGDVIRSFDGYNNKDQVWDGTNKHNDRVPDGTYFYILKIKDVGTYKGWILVRGNS